MGDFQIEDFVLVENAYPIWLGQIKHLMMTGDYIIQHHKGIHWRVLPGRDLISIKNLEWERLGIYLSQMNVADAQKLKQLIKNG